MGAGRGGGGGGGGDGGHGMVGGWGGGVARKIPVSLSEPMWKDPNTKRFKRTLAYS